MISKKYEIKIYPDIFIGLTIYKTKKIFIKGNNYKLKELKINELPWRWYVNVFNCYCVKAFLLKENLRILGYPINLKSKAAYEIPENMYLVLDYNSIWAMNIKNFKDEFILIDSLLP